MKKVISCIVFCFITVLIIACVNNVLVPKSTNRYYIMENDPASTPENYDVHVFGSCHAYTSFNPTYLENTYNISSYVYANAGEIIPTTYVRMKEVFEDDAPQIALVEIWGINPYDTYDTQENIFGHYLQSNVERLPISIEKQQLIELYDLDPLAMNFPIAQYKDRLMDFSLTEVDFNYSFEKTEPYSSYYVFSEMSSRLKNNGFREYPPNSLEDYPDLQAVIKEDDYLEIESDIVLYIEKIIALCEENNVRLIFYRSPYISTQNELKKLKHFEDICAEHNVTFINLEEEMTFDYTNDFYDYQHLSLPGANKATAFLSNYITYILTP